MTKFSQYREVVLPAGLLTSLIIGAGIFALPFVFAEAGFAAGFFYIALFSSVFVAVHRMYLEIIETTPGRHRFVGFAEIYLGRSGFWISLFKTLLGYMLILTVYIVLAGSFIGLVAPGVQTASAAIIFWTLGSAAIAASLARLGKLDFVATLAMVAIILFLFFIGLGGVRGVVPPVFNSSQFFLPYGVVLFAFAGRAAISSLWKYAKRNMIEMKKLYRSVLLGTAFPAVLYALFVFAVFWLSDGGVSQDALTGIRSVAPGVLSVIGVLGIIALWTSYFFLGIEVRDILQYDFHWRRTLAAFSVLVFPALFYLAGMSNFILLIGVVGSIFLAGESAMVVLMHARVRGWSVSAWLLILVFLGGAIYEFIQFF